MSKIYPFMAKRAGSRNWYFKRDYPMDVTKKAGEQFWRSLGSPDQRKAAEHYADKAHEFEAIVKERRQGKSRNRNRNNGTPNTGSQSENSTLTGCYEASG